MAALVREKYFVCTDIDVNANKFWRIQQFDDHSVVTIYGRVGISEAATTKHFGDEHEADKFFGRKVNEKTKVKSHRDAYTEIDILTSTQCSRKDVPKDRLADIAAQEIDVDCETTRDLIRWLSSVNIHQILQSTTMTYNEAEGVFRTPLGVVGKSMVDRARVLLNEIAPYVEHGQYADAGLKKIANEYLRLIPQDLGGTHVKLKLERIFTREKLKEQADVLDALDASIASVLTVPTKTTEDESPRQRTFNLKLHAVDDPQQIEDVKKKFNHTKQRQHTSYAFDFKGLYAVDIPSMRAAWENDGAKLDNRMRLWHGTKPSNVLSILKQGLVIPPATASYVCGRAYGNGIYFSDQSTKSLNYACGYWGGGDQGNRVFMFLADVGMGNYHVPSGSISKIPAGYDSCFAHAGQSGVANHEMIVYRVSQCNLVYLVEFSR